MRAHGGHAGRGQQRPGGRGLLVFLEREACRWAEARTELERLRADLRALPPQQAKETAPSAIRCWSATPPNS